MEDVCLIAEEMQKNGWCPAGQMPAQRKYLVGKF